MTINFNTAATGIFARLRKIFGIIIRVEDFQTQIIDNADNSFQEALNEYVNTLNATSNTDLDFADSLISGLDEVRNSAGNLILKRVMTVSQKTLVRMVDADKKLPIRSVDRALVELRDQMLAGSQTLNASVTTVGSTSAAGTGTGTVIVDVEADNRYHSGNAQYPRIRTETLNFECVRDSTSVNVPRGGERFIISGEQPYPALDHRWPGGTGTWGTYACTSDLGSDGQSAGKNVLRNSSFNSFDGDAPVNWDIAVGAASSEVFASTSDAARGTNSLKLTNDGSTLIRLMQEIDSKSQTGTRGKIRADASVALSFLVKRSGTGPSAGALQVGLFQSDGTAVSGATTTVAHGAITTSYALKTLSFRVPLSLPNPVYFGIKVSTAFTSGCHLHIDALVFAEMHRRQAGGAACLIVPGATDFIVGDEMNVSLSNDNGGVMEKLMDRVFNTFHLGIFMPNATSSETIADPPLS